MKRLFLTGILTAALAGSAYASAAEVIRLKPDPTTTATIRLTPDPTTTPVELEANPAMSLQAAQAGAGTQAATPDKPAKGAKARASRQAGDKAAAGNNLGSIRLPKTVTANGQPLKAGTYQVRLTDETAKAVAGETPDSERWVEFVQGGAVKGKELASVIPDSEIAQVAEGPGKPAKNGHRVDLLKTQKYWRVWINKGGNNYLIHLPPEGRAGKTGSPAK